MSGIKEVPRDLTLLERKRVVGVGDMQISNDPGEVLVTFSLGSCVAVVIYDPVAKVGGMLHAMLPDAAIAVDKEGYDPYKYVNSGLPLLFKGCYQLGAQKNRIKVKLAGCSNVLDNADFFNIGKRNYAATRKSLWKNNVMVDDEYCGSNESITLFLDLGNGDVIMKIKSLYYQLGIKS